MSIIETLISSIAPHECMGCRQQGTPLCDLCAEDLTQPVPSRCFRCLKRTQDFRVCPNCRRKSPLRQVWPASEYTPELAETIKAFKFHRNRALARPLANLICETLPYFPETPLVVPVPTAPQRVRARGYDQARLLSKLIAQNMGWQSIELLRREGTQRQVGTSRETRMQQLEKAFRPIRGTFTEKRHILLVDDVITTGATLSAAATSLKNSNARSISAVAIAHKS